MPDFQFSEGCPDGDACDECNHCVASWHTKPIERIVDMRTKETKRYRYCDLCPCTVEVAS